MSTELIAHAVMIAEELGAPVFPVRVFPDPEKPGKMKKHPLVSGWENCGAVTHPEQIEKLFSERPQATHVGLQTGERSRLLLVDLDGEPGVAWWREHAQLLPATRTQRTQRPGGKHLFYRIPRGCGLRNTASKIAPGVDIRADGGFAVDWSRDYPPDLNDIADAPPALIEFLRRASAKAAPGAAAAASSTPAREGSRNDTLTRLAGKLRRNGLDATELEAALLAANARRCVPPLHDAEVTAIAKSVARYEPARATNGSAPQTETANPSAPDPAMLQAVRSLSLSSLHDVNAAEHAPKTPILEELLYPGAWLVVGRPKIGKSWLLLQLALAVADNAAFLGYATVIPNAEVLAIFGEDDDGRIKSRLQALGVARAPQSCHVINQQQFFGFAERFAEHMTFAEFLSTWLNEHPLVKLVIVDTETTVRQIWAGEHGDENGRRVTETDYRQTRAYDAIGLDRQIAIALVNHASKRKGEWTDIHELINRSNTALAGASGSIVLADPPDADPLDPAQKTRILGVRGRDLRDDIMLGVHQREDMPYFVSDGPYVEVRQTAAEQVLMEALEELMADTDATEYVTTAELAESIGKTRGTVKRVMSRMLSKNRTTWKKLRLNAKRGKGGGFRLDPT